MRFQREAMGVTQRTNSKIAENKDSVFNKSTG